MSHQASSRTDSAVAGEQFPSLCALRAADPARGAFDVCRLRIQIGLCGFPSAPARAERRDSARRSGEINDHSCDRLPDIVVAVADAQSDTDRFERKAHHADRLVVELFAVEQGPKGMITRRRDVIARHAAGTFDTRLFEAREPRRAGAQDLLTRGRCAKMTSKPSGVGSLPDSNNRK